MSLETPNKAKKIREAIQHIGLKAYTFSIQNTKYTGLRKRKNGRHRHGDFSNWTRQC